MCVLFLATMGGRRAPEPRVVMVVNSANATTSMSREQVAKIFLRQLAAWASGDEILPVDQMERAPARAAFARDVEQTSVKSLKIYWQQRIFSGEESPPPERVSDSDVLIYVRSNVGAIGYVLEGTDLGIGVKTLTVTASVSRLQ
jgi:ABC-type phosphate transport system substrate-binding protein